MNLEEQVALLALELRELRDRQDILDCVNRYGRGLDRLDAECLRDAFHAGGIDDHGAFVGPVEDFVPWAIDCEAAFAVTHHTIGSHSCEIDGETAHAESYVHFLVQHQKTKSIGVGVGRYLDRLECREGRWAIVVRRFVLDMTFTAEASDWLGPEWSAAPPRRDRTDLVYQRPLRSPNAAETR